MNMPRTSSQRIQEQFAPERMSRCAADTKVSDEGAVVAFKPITTEHWMSEVGGRLLRHAISHLIRTRGAGIDQADLAALDLMARAMRIVENERIETVDRPPGATECPRIRFQDICDVRGHYFEMVTLNRPLGRFLSFWRQNESGTAHETENTRSCGSCCANILAKWHRHGKEGHAPADALSSNFTSI